MDAAAMIAELDDHGFQDESSTAKVRALQHSIRNIESREPWPFLEASLLLTFDGSSSVPTNVPSTLKSVRSISMTNGNRLRPLLIEEFEDIANSEYTRQGNSVVYYFDGLSLNVWPVPGATSTAQMRYSKWSADITSTSLESAFLIPKWYHQLIVYGALWRLYDMEDDPELAARYEQHLESGLALMRSAIFQRQVDAPNHIQILDHDDWYNDY